MSQNIPHVGERVPNFRLFSTGSEAFELTTACQQGASLVLIFYRGHW
jgi:peroxiredoxin